MKEDNNAEYLSVLATLGATISRYKNDLAFARYDIERLQKKLDEANKEIKQSKESKKDAK